jgi:hypothetical protein
MKKTVFLFIAAILLLSCCTRGKYSARLVAADSLMNAHPDSAYAILKSISPDTLPSKGDRAYYALLFTQAMYKNYDSIRSDSLINIAVNFFSDNHDREKYTRSLIYKGAALNDMGDFLGAMHSYKAAEANADSNDYENKGQVNLRMAELYEDMEIDMNISIEKYKKSLLNFEKSGNKKYQQKCLSTIGCKYRAYPIDSAYKYLFHALKLSKELGDSCAIYINISSLARAYWADSMYQKCKDYAVFAIKNGKQYMTDQDCYYDAANSYAKLGKIDSAEYYFNQIKVGSTIEDKVSYEYSLMQILRAKGNFKSALEHFLKGESMFNSFTNNPVRSQLLFSERQYDNQKNELEKAKSSKEKVLLLLIIASSIILLLIAWIIIVRKRAQMRNYQELITRLQEEKSESKISLLQNIDKESKLQSILQNQIVNIRDLIDLSFRYESKPSVFIKLFHEKMKYTKLPDSFWLDLRHYVNLCHNNVLTEIHGRFPSLNDDEMNLICLLCCDFSYIEITICMGYTNAHYVNNKKARIARKMGLSVSLKEYLDELIAHPSK